MLISHKYKFIFVKTVKTAGTSIEVELSKIMGPTDIVTPIIPPEEGHVARNFQVQTPHGIFEVKNHMPAFKLKSVMAPQMFNGYFKFCVEREPVDKCVSHFSMLKNSPIHNKGNEGITWESYLDRGNFPTDFIRYCDPQGNLLVDRILKYEDLTNELRSVASQIGFPFEKVYSTAKSGWREKIDVTDAQKERIYEAFAPTLPFTGYAL